MERWKEQTFERLEAKARAYFRAGAEAVRPISMQFFTDCDRFESVGYAWRTHVAGRYADRFVELVESAERAGEARPVNARFLAGLLKSMGFAARDEALLNTSGLSHEEAILEVDAILWEDIQSREGCEGGT